MKNNVFVLVAVLFAASFCYPLSGTIDSTNNHWGVGGNVASPVEIDSAVAVGPAQVDLVIEPGTVVLFKKAAPINISGKGRVVATGTADRRIEFKSASATPLTEDWDWIFIEKTERMSVFEYCAVSGVCTPFMVEKGGKCRINRCVLTRYFGPGIACINADSVVITNNTIVPRSLLPANVIFVTRSHAVIRNNILGSPRVKSNYGIVTTGACRIDEGNNLINADQPCFNFMLGKGDVVNKDPLFADEHGEDFRLRSGSPARAGGSERMGACPPVRKK